MTLSTTICITTLETFKFYIANYFRRKMLKTNKQITVLPLLTPMALKRKNECPHYGPNMKDLAL